LKSVAVGGNKKFFDTVKEYDLLETEFEAKYATAALKWFTARHQAKCDGTISQFDMVKPPKNFAERIEAISESMDLTKSENAIAAEKSAADFSLALDNGVASLGSKFSLMR